MHADLHITHLMHASLAHVHTGTATVHVCMCHEPHAPQSGAHSLSTCRTHGPTYITWDLLCAEEAQPRLRSAIFVCVILSGSSLCRTKLHRASSQWSFLRPNASHRPELGESPATCQTAYPLIPTHLANTAEADMCISRCALAGLSCISYGANDGCKLRFGRRQCGQLVGMVDGGNDFVVAVTIEVLPLGRAESGCFLAVIC